MIIAAGKLAESLALPLEDTEVDQKGEAEEARLAIRRRVLRKKRGECVRRCATLLLESCPHLRYVRLVARCVFDFLPRLRIPEVEGYRIGRPAHTSPWSGATIEAARLRAYSVDLCAVLKVSERRHTRFGGAEVL